MGEYVCGGYVWVGWGGWVGVGVVCVCVRARVCRFFSRVTCGPAQ